MLRSGLPQVFIYNTSEEINLLAITVLHHLSHARTGVAAVKCSFSVAAPVPEAAPVREYC